MKRRNFIATIATAVCALATGTVNAFAARKPLRVNHVHWESEETPINYFWQSWIVYGTENQMQELANSLSHNSEFQTEFMEGMEAIGKHELAIMQRLDRKVEGDEGRIATEKDRKTAIAAISDVGPISVLKSITYKFQPLSEMGHFTKSEYEAIAAHRWNKICGRFEQLHPGVKMI